MEGHLPQAQISPFDPDGDFSSQSPRWKKWVSRLNTLFIAHGIESSERKKAVLLLYAGEAVNDIYDAIPQVEKNPEEGEDVYVKAKVLKKSTSSETVSRNQCKHWTNITLSYVS